MTKNIKQHLVEMRSSNNDDEDVLRENIKTDLDLRDMYVKLNKGRVGKPIRFKNFKGDKVEENKNSVVLEVGEKYFLGVKGHSGTAMLFEYNNKRYSDIVLTKKTSSILKKFL